MNVKCIVAAWHCWYACQKQFATCDGEVFCTPNAGLPVPCIITVPHAFGAVCAVALLLCTNTRPATIRRATRTTPPITSKPFFLENMCLLLLGENDVSVQLLYVAVNQP